MTTAATRVGPYELLRPLGEGGMAETFVAVRRGPAAFEQRVCLKRILPERAADLTFVELFLDEARLLGRLQCRNIVHVYDFGSASGTYYMALELVEGLDLAKLLANLREQGRRISQGLALHIFSEVLVALSYAHALTIDGEPQGIVHRDISPSNILISRHGEVKLTDFGIAKARGRLHHTQAGHVKGKTAYMSPEQVKAGELDGRSDLFSLGIVLFELLTGVHPFDGATDLAIQLSIIAGKRPLLATLRPDLPESVVSLVDGLLATDPSQRPATASDALALLPPAQPFFTQQQQLAELVAMRHEGTTEDAALPCPVTRPEPLSAEEWAAAVDSSAPTRSAAASSGPARVLPTEPLRAQRSGAWLLAPLLLVAAGAAYAWLSRAPTGPARLPALTTLVGEGPPAQAPSRAAPSSGSPASVQSSPVTQPARVPPGVEAVISPAKRGLRPQPQPVEVVVSPPKSVMPARPEPLPVVISPPKGSGRPRAEPIEVVISPSKGGQRTAPPADVASVISPPK